MRACLAALCLFVLGAAPVHAQLGSPTYVFVDGTTASSDEVNATFATVYANALNRLAGVMGGHLTFGTDNTHDIGATGATRPRDFFLGRNAAIGGTLTVGSTLAVTGTSTFTGAVTLSTLACTGCVDAAQLAATAVAANTYGNGTTHIPGSFVVDADGRLTSVTQAAVSALTGIAEAGITDGSLLARVASTETISGAWTFSTAPTLAGTNVTAIPEANITDGSLLARLAANETVSGTWTFSGTLTVGAISVGTAWAFPDGSDFTPSISFASDPDTGRFWSGPDQMCDAAGGLTAWCVTNASGNVTFTTPEGSGKWGLSLIPVVNGSYTLGRTDLRWSEAWVTAGAFNSSDRRLKKNIAPVSLGLDFIRQLQPVEYDWINPKLTGHYYGFIAQDLQALGFKAVDTSNPDEYGLRYTDLLAPLVKAVQELTTRLEALEGSR